MNRKKFISCGCALATGSIFGSALLTSCTTTKSISFTLNDGKIQVRKEDLNENSFSLLRVDGLRAPIYLNKNSDGQYVALLLECTHQKCELSPSSVALQCGCHGSVFNLDGDVIEAPATEPLTKFEVIDNESSLIIQ